MAEPSKHPRRRRRAVRLTATAAGLAGLLGTLTPALAPPAIAVPAVPAAVFDPNAASWASYRDQSSAAFSATFADKAAHGYLPIDIDIDTNGGYAVGSVWQKNLDGRAWKEKRDLTSAQFHAEWTAAKNAGMRPVEQHTYLLGGARRYAGIWVKNIEGYAWASHRGQTNTQFKASYDQHRAAGLMPIDYDEYRTSSGLRYNSVWVKAPSNTSWYLYRGLGSTAFGQKVEALKSSHRVLAFDSLRDDRVQRYAGIWVSNTNHRAWAVRRDMTKQSYDNYWRRYLDLGYRVASFERYSTASGDRYAAVWRQNSDRPDWALRSKVDALVASEMAGGVPGMSVAIYRNGKPVYLRGFGSADVGKTVWMDSAHIGSLASVSKAVAGVLTMRMIEQGLVELDDKTRTWVPTMPAKHTHTVGQLLSNRGCVRHYVSGEDGFANKPYATALDASEEFWDDDLVCDPGEYSYSTHGYTLLGAALEAAGDDDVKDLVRRKLTTPYGLGTLRPQTTTGHRMSIYRDADNTKISEYNNDWKVLGGGLEASAADLARFGADLIGGKIISGSSRTTMWTPPDDASGYAYGWNTGTEKGTQVVAKDGSFTGSLAYLRLYPEKGISIAVMANSRDKGASAVDLGQAVGTLVLDSVG